MELALHRLPIKKVQQFFTLPPAQDRSPVFDQYCSVMSDPFDFNTSRGELRSTSGDSLVGITPDGKTDVIAFKQAQLNQALTVPLEEPAPVSKESTIRSRIKFLSALKPHRGHVQDCFVV